MIRSRGQNLEAEARVSRGQRLTSRLVCSQPNEFPSVLGHLWSGDVHPLKTMPPMLWNKGSNKSRKNWTTQVHMENSAGKVVVVVDVIVKT